MIARLDNTVMSNFAAVERPDLLRAAFGRGLATSRLKIPVLGYPGCVGAPDRHRFSQP